MYWDNDVAPPLSVSFIRSLSLCCISCLGWSHQCQVSTFLWSGGANWLPSLPCLGHRWDISDLSQNKSNKVRDRDIAWLIRLEPELMTEWRAEHGNYILINPDLMIFSLTHWPTFYIILHCAMLAPVLGQIVKFDQIPNTKYIISSWKMIEYWIPNSAIRT